MLNVCEAVVELSASKVQLLADLVRLGDSSGTKVHADLPDTSRVFGMLCGSQCSLLTWL
jgi:hypothetical protein